MSIEACLKRLHVLYDAMDRAYGDVAIYYGFECTGCDDNCCSTNLYHHTVSEYLYLIKGLSTLPDAAREEILERAVTMCERQKSTRYMCPFNVEGRCVMYAFRPMICRLHGLPFELRWPDGRVERKPGCAEFERYRKRKGLPARRLDRTPFYTGLAGLETVIRKEIAYHGKFRKTLAEMIRDGTRLLD